MILRDVTAASTISASQRRVCWSAWDEHRIARNSRRVAISHFPDVAVQ
jgi:hypothetical protein